MDKGRQRRVPRETRICAAPGCITTFECKVTNKKRFCTPGHSRKGKTYRDLVVCAHPDCKNIIGEGNKKFCSRMCANKFNSPKKEVREKRSETMERVCGDPEYHENQCRIMRENWESSGYRDIMKKTWTFERLKKQSQSMKRSWQDPEYIAKQMRARNASPNKAEKFLIKLFQILLPDEYKFVGDGKFVEYIIAGKCPDFVNVAGQKKIIELFGEFFHKPEEEQERIDLFAQYGYQTLVIWYLELENVEMVCNNVLKFHVGETSYDTLTPPTTVQEPLLRRLDSYLETRVS